MKLARPLAIIPFIASASLEGKSGHFVTINGSGQVATAAAAGNVPIGLALTEGKAGESVSVALSRGGMAGTVRVKLAGNVTAVGTLLVHQAGGKVIADPNVGSRIVVAQALETGVTDELIEAILIPPMALA